ncbi:MAG: phosphatidylglycerophosphatase A [Sphingobacteriia bacterium 28-36-52]|jgi:phosphatidylglycerophosphatase A|nr:MAG: phosphatidylglycerophosphatase A [Sphingobacteriia bacterium 32-37-4]OYZ00349.1 MAG: phosphatidylglycerophosphatase A [Sphingobacteriia bacterium 28-36-52]
MIKFHQILTSFFGIGFISKGGGTVAAIATSLLWFVAIEVPNSFWVFLLTMMVTIYGVWGANQVEASWGKDSSKVVIDEVAGMMISLLFIPITEVNVLVALVLFRFFDIAKPFFIRKLENWPKGWGVMGDDILAGIYSNVVLQLLLYMNIW